MFKTEQTALCCAVCAANREAAFSKRQLKRAAERKPARCSNCIEQNLPLPEIDSKGENERKAEPKKIVDREDGNGKLLTKKRKSKEEKEVDKTLTREETNEKERLYFSDGGSVSEHSASSVSAATRSCSDQDPTTGKPSLQERKGDEMIAGDGVEISLNAIKQQVLGRLPRSGDQRDELNTSSIGIDSVSRIPRNVNLRKELSCAICHEPFYQPVSLHCGHSFCKDCFCWWIAHSQQQHGQTQETSQQQHGTCPTCRRPLTCDSQSLGVNTALRACVGALYPKELQTRIKAENEAKLKVTRGENEGAHSGGYVLLSAIEDEPWERTGLQNNVFLHVRRSIVMDANDQRMQLALALQIDESSFVRQKGDNFLQVVVCMLTMEEDEACDGAGFPWTIKEHEEDDNDALVARDRHSSFVDVTARVSSSETVPVARRGMRDGIASFLVDLGASTLQSMESICFCDEESKVQLEIKVPERRWLEGDGVADAADSQNAVEDGSNGLQMVDENEDEDSNLDQFEDDGFLVMEGEGHEESSDDENDVCCMCRQGGELMICDGGLNSVEGCGRNFHIDCVGRKSVPPGDWVCQSCANEHEMDVGREGHEFTDNEEEEEMDTKSATERASFAESDGGDESNEESNVESMKRASKKRRVIVDDSDEE